MNIKFIKRLQSSVAVFLVLAMLMPSVTLAQYSGDAGSPGHGGGVGEGDGGESSDTGPGPDGGYDSADPGEAAEAAEANEAATDAADVSAAAEAAGVSADISAADTTGTATPGNVSVNGVEMSKADAMSAISAMSTASAIGVTANQAATFSAHAAGCDGCVVGSISGVQGPPSVVGRAEVAASANLSAVDKAAAASINAVAAQSYANLSLNTTPPTQNSLTVLGNNVAAMEAALANITAEVAKSVASLGVTSANAAVNKADVTISAKSYNLADTAANRAAVESFNAAAKAAVDKFKADDDVESYLDAVDALADKMHSDFPGSIGYQSLGIEGVGNSSNASAGTTGAGNSVSGVADNSSAADAQTTSDINDAAGRGSFGPGGTKSSEITGKAPGFSFSSDLGKQSAEAQNTQSTNETASTQGSGSTQAGQGSGNQTGSGSGSNSTSQGTGNSSGQTTGTANSSGSNQTGKESNDRSNSNNDSPSPQDKSDALAEKVKQRDESITFAEVMKELFGVGSANAGEAGDPGGTSESTDEEAKIQQPAIPGPSNDNVTYIRVQNIGDFTPSEAVSQGYIPIEGSVPTGYSGPTITNEDIKNIGLMLQGELEADTAANIRSGKVTEEDVATAAVLAGSMVNRWLSNSGYTVKGSSGKTRYDSLSDAVLAKNQSYVFKNGEPTKVADDNYKSAPAAVDEFTKKLFDGSFANEFGHEDVNQCPSCDSFDNPQTAPSGFFSDGEVSRSFDDNTQKAIDRNTMWNYNGHVAPGVESALAKDLRASLTFNQRDIQTNTPNPANLFSPTTLDQVPGNGNDSAETESSNEEDGHDHSAETSDNTENSTEETTSQGPTADYVDPITGKMSGRTSQWGWGLRGRGPNSGHAGVDIDADLGTTVVSPANGTVVARNGSSKGYGHYMDIQDENGFVHRMAHIDFARGVAVGDKVAQGQAIGVVSGAGTNIGKLTDHYKGDYAAAQNEYNTNPKARVGVTPAHVHYEVRKAEDYNNGVKAGMKGTVDPASLNPNLTKGVQLSANNPANSGNTATAPASPSTPATTPTATADVPSATSKEVQDIAEKARGIAGTSALGNPTSVTPESAVDRFSRQAGNVVSKGLGVLSQAFAPSFTTEDTTAPTALTDEEFASRYGPRSSSPSLSKSDLADALAAQADVISKSDALGRLADTIAKDITEKAVTTDTLGKLGDLVGDIEAAKSTYNEALEATTVGDIAKAKASRDEADKAFDDIAAKAKDLDAVLGNTPDRADVSPAKSIADRAVEAFSPKSAVDVISAVVSPQSYVAMKAVKAIANWLDIDFTNSNGDTVSNTDNESESSSATSTDPVKKPTVIVGVTVNADTQAVDFSVIEKIFSERITYPPLPDDFDFGDSPDDESDWDENSIINIEEKDPLVLNEFGEVVYSDGTYAPVIQNGRQVGEASQNYSYVLQVISNDESVDMNDNVDAVAKNALSEIVSDLFQLNDAYIVADVSAITRELIDPDESIERDEYYKYVVTLTNGSVRSTEVPQYTSVKFMSQKFAETGFSGDVVELIGLAIEKNRQPSMTSSVLVSAKNFFSSLVGKKALESTTPDSNNLSNLVPSDDGSYGLNDIRNVNIYLDISANCPNVPGLDKAYIYEVVVDKSAIPNATQNGLLQDIRCGTGEPLQYAGEVATHLARAHGFELINAESLLEKVEFNFYNPPPANTETATVIETAEVIEEPVEETEVTFLPNLTNNVTFEAKAIGSNGLTKIDWTTDSLTLSSDAKLVFRWDGSDYSQCLPFLNDGGNYSLTRTGDSEMTTGNTEESNYSVPVRSGTYRIECGGQKNNEFGVDAREINVTVQ